MGRVDPVAPLTREQLDPAVLFDAVSMEVVGGSRINTRGHSWQDRWAAGGGQLCTWMAVADGITGGGSGAAAAQCAVEMATHVLGMGVAAEASVIAAFAAARAAVNPWYLNSSAGGTTLCVMVADTRRAVVGWVGDSAAFALVEGRLERITPARSGSALTHWVGDGTVEPPQLRSFELSGPAVLVLATDGLELDGIEWDGLDPRGFVGRALTQCRVPSGDDATLVVASGR